MEINGVRLKKIREDNGLSQAELADRVKVAASDIYRYESGIVKSPSPKRVKAIAKALNVEVADLVLETEEVVDTVELTVVYNVYGIEAIKLEGKDMYVTENEMFQSGRRQLAKFRVPTQIARYMVKMLSIGLGKEQDEPGFLVANQIQRQFG